MEHSGGLDVSVKETSVCIVDGTGKIVREVKVASEPDALLAVLRSPTYRFKRIGLEAGPLSQWLFSALAEAGLPVICVETRHMRAALKGADQQDRPQRRPRHSPDRRGGFSSMLPIKAAAISDVHTAIMNAARFNLAVTLDCPYGSVQLH